MCMYRTLWMLWHMTFIGAHRSRHVIESAADRPMPYLATGEWAQPCRRQSMRVGFNSMPQIVVDSSCGICTTRTSAASSAHLRPAPSPLFARARTEATVCLHFASRLAQSTYWRSCAPSWRSAEAVTADAVGVVCNRRFNNNWAISFVLLCIILAMCAVRSITLLLSGTFINSAACWKRVRNV